MGAAHQPGSGPLVSPSKTSGRWSGMLADITHSTAPVSVAKVLPAVLTAGNAEEGGDGKKWGGNRASSDE